MRTGSRRGTGRRRTNLALLVLLPMAVLSGLFANAIGSDWPLHPSTVHGTIAVAILLLAPWKSVIVRRGLRRRTPSRWNSLALLGLVLSSMATGLLHAAGYQGGIGPLTVMQVHIGGAVIALVLVIAHYRSHPVPARRPDWDRRSFLGVAGLAGAASVTLVAWETILGAVGLPGSNRRFTGSHERGSFRPERMPITQWLDDRVQHIPEGEWTLRVGARSLTLADVESLPSWDLTATLDCTSGWYSEQDWSGVRLDRLVDPGTCRSVEVRSITGYARRVPARDLHRIWLATHVGGEPLTPAHGFPARLVAPGRRGFWWVKWVTDITPSDLPWWVQSPFPVT